MYKENSPQDTSWTEYSELAVPGTLVLDLGVCVVVVVGGGNQRENDCSLGKREND